jgi:hypothetical protein
MEEQFRIEFVDGELRVYNSDNRLIIKQNKFPDGSNDPWTEDDALAWWETKKQRCYQPVAEWYDLDDSTIPDPNEGA